MQTWKPEITWRDPKSLTPYARNARIHSTEQVDELAGQIAAVGWTQPIVVDKDGVIVIGHGRREAALRLALTEVPVVTADHLSEYELAALRIADNKLAEKAKWDLPLLSFELGTIERHELDLTTTGFSMAEARNILANFHGAEVPASPSDASSENGAKELSEQSFQTKPLLCPHCGKEFQPGQHSEVRAVEAGPASAP